MAFAPQPARTRPESHASPPLSRIGPKVEARSRIRGTDLRRKFRHNIDFGTRPSREAEQVFGGAGRANDCIRSMAASERRSSVPRRVQHQEPGFSDRHVFSRTATAESLFLQRLETIARYGVYVSAASLAFTRALTINIGWPLKIYEVLLTLAIAYYLVVRWDRTRPAFLRPEIIAILSFCTWCGVGLAVNYFRGMIPDTSGTPARFSPLLDGTATLAYFIFDMLALVVVARHFSGHARTIARWWLWGTIVAGAYGWVLFLSSYAGLTVWLLPGSEIQWFKHGGHSALRMGTFLEGN